MLTSVLIKPKWNGCFAVISIQWASVFGLGNGFDFLVVIGCTDFLGN